MLVQQFLEDSARRFPDKTALVCGSRRFTYGGLDAQANRLARDLAASGISRGDRVAVYLENSPETVMAIFAILKAGAVFLVINPTVKPDKLVYIMENCRAKGLITDAQKATALGGCWEEMTHLAAVWVAGQAAPAGPKFRPLEPVLTAGDARAPENRCIDIDLAALIYTSGSTGKPKGVMLTHLNMVSAATSITTYLENTPDDMILNVLPLSFDYGLYQVLMGFKIGGTVILERSFTYPYVVIEKLIAEKVTGFPIVPTISAILLEMDLAKYRLSASPLHHQYCGGFAGQPDPAAARAVSAGEALLDVRADGVQARHLPAARSDRYPAGLGGARNAQRRGLPRRRAGQPPGTGSLPGSW